MSTFHLFLVSLLLARPSNPLLKENSNTIFSVTQATSSATATPGSVTLPMTTPRWRRLPLQREKEENILELLLRGYIDRQLLEEERALVTASPNKLPQSRLNKGDDLRKSVTLSPELTTPHTTPAGNGGLVPDLHPQWFYPKSNPSQKPIEEEGDLVTTDLVKSGPVTIYAPALVDDLVVEPDLGRAGETTTYQPAPSETTLPAGFEREATISSSDPLDSEPSCMSTLTF